MTAMLPAADTPTAATCDYCGLPVAGVQTDEAPSYCCFGCRFAAQITQAQGETASQRWMAMTLGLAVFCSMNAVMLTMALWSYAATPLSPFEHALADFFRYGALLFSTPVLLVLGRPLTASAIEQLRRGVWSTDLLLLTGVVAAYLVSVVSTVQSHGHVYFEVTCVILVLVSLGRWLEATGRLQATSALDQLERLLPETVRVLHDDDSEQVISRRDVQIGQQLRLLPGERIPLDGTVVRGRAVVDEQFFTGESTPSEKQPGERVLGGSLNLDGELIITVTALADAGALGRLLEAVRVARLTKGQFQLLADRWSQRFFPIITVVAISAFGVHTAWHGWEHGLLTALSVVLIACPCALALATPLAVWAALAHAASRGVLFRSGAVLEQLATVRAIRWDKTGTLTTGAPHVSALLLSTTTTRAEVERLAAALVATSGHTFSHAIREHFGDSGTLPRVSDLRSIAGRGLIATTDPYGEIVLGSVRWMHERGLSIDPQLSAALTVQEQSPASLVCIGWSQQVQGIFILRETLRTEAVQALEACRQQGLDLMVLTGDRRPRGQALAEELHVAVRAELLPEDKLAEIRQAQRTIGPVAMVGDGLNDAPALSAADVGIALGCGADVTRDSADVCLLSNDLHQVPWALQLAHDTVATIRQNLFWSFSYNSLGVIVAACGWLHPALAAVLMVVSSLMVLGNSLKLRGPIATTQDSPNLPTSPISTPHVMSEVTP